MTNLPRRMCLLVVLMRLLSYAVPQECAEKRRAGGWCSMVNWLRNEDVVTRLRTGKVLGLLSRCGAAALLSIGPSGCGMLRKKESKSDEQMAMQLSHKPMTSEKAEKVLSEMGENWLYGPGLGQTALNVGAMVVFPPYAVYVLGNSVLSMSGYEPLYVTDMLPDSERADINEVYDEVTTAPGRVSAALAGKEFRSREVAAARFKAVVSEGSTPSLGVGKKASSGG